MINDINEVETMKKRDKWRKREIERKKHGQSEICNICLTLPLSIFVWRTDHFGLGKNRCEVPPFRLSFGWLLDAASNRHNLKLKSHQTPCSPFDISNSSFSIDTLQFCDYFFLLLSFHFGYGNSFYLVRWICGNWSPYWIMVLSVRIMSIAVKVTYWVIHFISTHNYLTLLYFLNNFFFLSFFSLSFRFNYISGQYELLLRSRK